MAAIQTRLSRVFLTGRLALNERRVALRNALSKRAREATSANRQGQRRRRRWKWIKSIVALRRDASWGVTSRSVARRSVVMRSVDSAKLAALADKDNHPASAGLTSYVDGIVGSMSLVSSTGPGFQMAVTKAGGAIVGASLMRPANAFSIASCFPLARL